MNRILTVLTALLADPVTVTVRYALADNPTCNPDNAPGLKAALFRTEAATQLISFSLHYENHPCTQPHARDPRRRLEAAL